MKIGSFIISKPVGIRLGLIALVAVLMFVFDWLDKFVVWGLCMPITITEIVKQFRIDNSYDEPDEID